SPGCTSAGLPTSCRTVLRGRASETPRSTAPSRRNLVAHLAVEILEEGLPHRANLLRLLLRRDAEDDRLRAMGVSQHRGCGKEYDSYARCENCQMTSTHRPSSINTANTAHVKLRSRWPPHCRALPNLAQRQVRR